MKKNKVLKLFTLLGSSLLFASCSPSFTVNDSTEDTNIVSKTNMETVSYQLVTSNALISSTTQSIRSRIRKAVQDTTSPIDQPTTTQTTSSEVETLLAQIEIFQANDNNIKVEPLTSDKAEYESLEKITYIDLKGESTTMEMYYNTIKTVTKQEVDLDDDKDDDDDLDEKEEVETKEETKSKLEGIIINNNLEYNFEAVKEIESEVDGEESENESELKTKIFTSTDKTSYILASYSFEESTERNTKETEEEYKYMIVENNVVKESFSYEIENENNQEEIKVTLGNANYFVKMENENGKTLFLIVDKTKNTTSRYEKVIDQTTGQVTYVLLNK